MNVPLPDHTASPSSRSVAVPRVLVVMGDQWERALLRASLREVGYDALGARDALEARRYAVTEPGRGAVGLIVVDHDAAAVGADALREAVAAHNDPPVVLIAHGTHQAPAGTWRLVLHRPLAVADVVSAIQSALPLPEEARRPLDVGE